MTPFAAMHLTLFFTNRWKSIVFVTTHTGAILVPAASQYSPQSNAPSLDTNQTSDWAVVVQIMPMTSQEPIEQADSEAQLSYRALMGSKILRQGIKLRFCASNA
jgi:hypothetical protein